MSVFTYNGISLPYPLATNFSQEAVYDDVSGTDRCYTKFDITVQALINFNYMSDIAPALVRADGSTDTNNPASIMRFIRNSLLQQRKTLSYTFNERELIPGKAGVDGTVDAKNGPLPQWCNIVMFTNTTFLVNYRIIAHYWENYDSDNTSVGRPNRRGNRVLFNRWSENVQIDNKNYSTRIREGKFMIRSDKGSASLADEIRSEMAVVGVPSGFLRKSSSYTVSPDGLGISYRVEDQEVYTHPPTPAYVSDGEYTESTTRNGAIRHGTIRVRLEGSKTTNRAHLIEKALAVASVKLLNAGAERDPGAGGIGLLHSSSVSVKLYENIVEVKMSAQFPARNGRLVGVAGYDFQKIASTPFSNPGVGRPVYLDYGTANYVMRSAAYFDPSLTNTVLNPTTGQMTTGRVPGQAGVFSE